MAAEFPALTGLILAGGEGRRMGGQDKGLMPFHGRPLVAWVADALRGQVGRVLIVANRNTEAYAQYGEVIRDLRPGFAGPLAGIEAGLSAAAPGWILSCPVDAPLLPADYAARMLGGSTHPAHSAAGFCDGHLQPVYCVLPASVLPSLRSFLDAGERKAGKWLDSLPATRVDLSGMAAGLRDADTPQALALLQRDTQ